MKKLNLFAALLLSIAFTTTANAQFKFASGNETIKSPFEQSTKEFTNTRPLRNFSKEFPGVTDDAWAKTSNGFFVRFTSNGIQNQAFLDSRGNCESRIQYYTENELVADVRRQVKSSYYDYAITTVKEVTANHTTAYLITIEFKNIWKVIRVVDGEMDVWEDHVKS